MQGAQPAGGGDGVTPRSVLDALPRAIIVCDASGQILIWNTVAEELYGWAEAEVVGRPVLEVLSSPDSPASTTLLAQAASGESFVGERTIVGRDGVTRRVLAHTNPIRDDSGRVVAVLSVTEDLSGERQFERQASELAAHLKLALEAGGLGTWHWDMESGVTRWDERLEALFGLPPGGFDGTYETWMRMIHPDDRGEVQRIVDEALADRSPYHLEFRVLWPDGTERWLASTGSVTVDERGEPAGTIGCVADTTERAQAQLERDRATRAALELAEYERVHRERFEYLNQVNEVLSVSGSVEEIMANVTRTAVPRLGDWCAIHVLPITGSPIPDVEISHVDPAMVAYARELQERFPYDPQAPNGIPHVIRTGQPEFYPDITQEVIEGLGADEERLAVIEQLALRSAIAVPLIKRGRVLGAIQLVMSSSGRRYTEEDLALVQAVAARVAASIENRRLTERQALIAKTLQNSLLPDELPSIPGVEIAVRYWAAGVATDVGGDFYDVFDLGEKSWAAVIGDVCGTGPAAAALTGLARHSIRMSAWNGNGPAEVVRWLNHAIRQTRTDSFITTLYAEMRRHDAGVELTFASGGHPRPVVLKASGSVSVVPTSGALLGVFDKVSCEPVEVVLEPGDCIVLYTDGVTDLSPPDHLTEEDLAALVARSAAGTAEEVAERIHDELERIRPINDRHDDIALMVMHVEG